MPRYKILIEYDGGPFAGWQYQENSPSVQRTIMAAVEVFSGEKVMVQGAGRTDAGVHALGQVASVNVEFGLAASAVQRALNVRLPLDIRVIGVVDAPEGFHARYHATGKVYRYRIATTPVLSPFDRAYAFHGPGQYDLSSMRSAAEILVGRHDFASFQTLGSWPLDTTRTIHRLDVRATPSEIVIDVEGDGFLRHMVRAIAGTLVEVGQGQRPAESIATVLAARDRHAAGRTLPALGLTLVAVKY